jgi:hypothetical protein
MNDPKTQQLLIGGALLLAGLWGLFAPYRWNILRLKRSFAQHVSERTNQAIPRYVGGVLAALGILLFDRGPDDVTREIRDSPS